MPGVCELCERKPSTGISYVRRGLAKAKGGEGNISYFVICPGPTNTPMRKKIDPQADLRQGPAVIAEAIKKIITQTKYKNGDIIIVRDGKELKFKNI